MTSVAPSPGVLFLGLLHWWGQGRASSASRTHQRLCRQQQMLPRARLLLRAKKRKRLGEKSCVCVFLLRQARQSDDDAETRARRRRVRDTTAQHAEGAKMSFWSLLSMKGQVQLMLQSYGVMLPIKWNSDHSGCSDLGPFQSNLFKADKQMLTGPTYA